MKFENDMLYLSLCALHNIKPDIMRVEKMDLDILYKSCQLHKITALVCYALESVTTPSKKWLEAKGKAIRKNMLFDVESKQITGFMDKQGIKYLPLKGIILKEYYPKAGMRQMSDYDIYYDGNFREQLEAFMLSIGYECESKADNHDVYKKLPIYNFEMHHSFFSQEKYKALYRYYSDIENRMIKDENNACGYHLSNEDFYIYIIAHEYKHFSSSGTGIRSLLDCYILLNKFENQLDWDYIKCEIDKLGLTNFEETQRKLCQKLSAYLNIADFTKAEVEMLNYFVSCGVYGNLKTSVINKLTEETGKSNRKITFSIKVKYILKRLFPPMDFYKKEYPFFYQHKYLLPFCFFYRVYKALFKKSHYVKKEIEALKNPIK